MTDAEPPTVAYGRDLAVERALAERARSDRDAFAELYRLHVKAVYAFAHRISGSREVAEETTSATFERALRSIDRFEWAGGGLRPWLYRIASNEVMEHHRRGARSSGPRAQAALRALAPEEAADVADLAAALDGPDGLAALRTALATLRPRYREAITLRYLGELSADDAATALGCSKSTLAVTLHRALGALKRAMNDAERAGGAS
ncbi:MAG: putative polymerase sigma-H factor [Ilumatobacteraceae bacterium]|nr:putative polymerase sigma-H factor [Ilumatobacteraceae bacterium]